MSHRRLRRRRVAAFVACSAVFLVYRNLVPPSQVRQQLQSRVQPADCLADGPSRQDSHDRPLFRPSSRPADGRRSVGSAGDEAGDEPQSSDDASKLNHEGRLIVAVDNQGSCPDKCVFLHKHLPSWLPFRYTSFGSPVDVGAMIDRYANTTHFLFVHRGIDKSLGPLAAEINRRRRSFPRTSFGVFHMSDEFLQHSTRAYRRFDYVLRHYYTDRDTHRSHLRNRIPVRALGNISCGIDRHGPLPVQTVSSHSQIDSDQTRSFEPRWGVHWLFLTEDTPVLSSRSPSTPWPVSQRPVPCSFSGRTTPARQDMATAFRRHNDVPCTINFTKGFRQGQSTWNYVTRDITQSKIGLHPPGNNHECYRMFELLTVGTVPAMLQDTPFRTALFQPIPAIVGATWDDVAKEIKRLLSRQDQLQQLSTQGVQFYHRLLSCIQSDLSYIFRHAFGTKTSS